MQKILIIVGPTAIGKTSLGIRLAHEFRTEIISGDSMQVYQEVNIGTAKPNLSEQAEIKHHLIDHHSIFDEYSVKDFVFEAEQEIHKLTELNKLPIIVGGTGFYLNALINDLKLGEEGTYDNPVEYKWEEYLNKNGPKKLWDKLYELDPVATKQIPWQNERRVLRALSVISRTNQLFSNQQTEITKRFDAKIIGLTTERTTIYARINERVDQMIKNGLLDEAEFIFNHRNEVFQAKQAIGYKEIFPYFLGDIDLETAVAKLKQASRKYAKRQLTYFKNKMDVAWFDPLNDTDYYQKILIEIEEWLND